MGPWRPQTLGNLTVPTNNISAISALEARLAELTGNTQADPDPAVQDKREDKIRSIASELYIRKIGRHFQWSEQAIEHAVETAGINYGQECVVPLTNGRTLRTPAHPASCSYVRVEHAGHELGFWSSDEWSQDGEIVVGAILGLAHGGAGVSSARFGFIYEPINNIEEAKRFLANLYANDLLFHLDDDPASIVRLQVGQPDAAVFLPCELEHVRARRDELFQLPDFDPHGYCLSLIGA